jgi:beta-galactosidase/beta-glucuronidase
VPTLTVVGGPSLAAADEPRNLAYHRAVVQSSAVDYDHTGHAVTDGIYTDYGAGTGADSGRTEPAFSSQFTPPNATEGIEMAFDRMERTKVYLNRSAAWLQVRLPRAGTAVSYSLTSADDQPASDPKAWTLEGSADGATWTALDSQSDQTFPARRATRVFPLTTPGSYEFYRLTVTANNGAENSLQVAEFDLHWDAAGEQTLIESTANPSYRAKAIDSPVAESLPLLFDGLGSSKWLTYVTVGWVQIHLPEARPIGTYTITTANDDNLRDPSGWSLLGSVDGIAWTVLDTRGAALPNSRTTLATFTPTQTGTYSYYRLATTGNRGDPGWDNDPVYPSAPRLQLGDWNILDPGGNTIVRPVAAPDPSGIEYSDSAGDSPSGESPAEAFDKTTATKWLTFTVPSWLQVRLAAASTAVTYAISAGNDQPSRDPRNFTVQGSNDGQAFTTLDTRTGQTWADRYATNTYTIADPGSYRYYRLNISTNAGDSRIQLSEFDLFDADGETIVPFVDVFDSQWLASGASTQSLVVDLGGPSDVSGANLFWHLTNFAVDYSIDSSPDGETWSRAYSTTHGVGGTEEITFTATGARYVRLNLVTPSGSRFALQEFEILGTGGAEYSLPVQPGPTADGRQYLTGGNWAVHRASEVEGSGASLSGAGVDTSAWIPAVVPGTVLTSYIKAGAVVDPEFSDYQLQISDKYFTADYWYRDEFTIPAAQEGKRTWLNFEAINWKADIWFNGSQVGRIDGAFKRGKFDVTSLARYGQDNYLAVLIHKNETPGAVTVQTLASAGGNGGALGADNPTIHASVGWDWVPTVRGRNIGIYDDVYLSYSDDVTVGNSWATVDLSGSAAEGNPAPDADVTVITEVSNPSAQARDITVRGTIEPGGYTFTSAPISLAAGEVREVEAGTVHMVRPDLWWPNGYGDQPLYEVNVEAVVGGNVSDVQTFKAGIREFTYSTGSPLIIYCNGVRIVSRGGNWGLPDENLEVTPAGYDLKMRLHAEANLNMVRNWVGQTGDEAFYEAADRWGILIWDDFWLANPGDGPNPNDEVMFMDNAVDKVKRNRHHAALVLYCGRNEGDPPATLNTALRQVTTDLDGTRIYIPHSAAGTVSGFGPYGVQNPRYYFQNTGATLHSERGMPNIPTIESLTRMFGSDHLWPIDSVWGLHDFCNSAQGSNAWLNYIANSYGTYNSAKEFSDLSQLVNYENHKALFEAVYARAGNGMLMWMSQSAWPSTVWQTYDYYNELNGGWYGIRKANQPVNAIFDPRDNSVILSNATNSTLTNAQVEVEVFNLAGQLVDSASVVTSREPGAASRALAVPAAPEAGAVRLLRTHVRVGGEEIASNTYWTNPSNYGRYQDLRDLAEATVSVSATHTGTRPEDGWEKIAVAITNTATDAPAFMTRIKGMNEDGEQILPLVMDDNYLTIMPGETVTVEGYYDPAALGGTETWISVEALNQAAPQVVSAESEEPIDILALAIQTYSLFAADPDRYTPESLAPLEAAIADAETMLSWGRVSWDGALERIEAMRVAAAGLVEAVETRTLTDLIAAAEAILASPGDYVARNLPALAAAVDHARVVVATPGITQDVVLAESVALLEAMAVVHPKGDRTSLGALIATIESLSPDRFTPSSWASVEAALAAARLVEANPEASVFEVDAAFEDLADASAGLALRAAKAGLNSAISVAQHIVTTPGSYVPASLVGLSEALDEAQRVYADHDATAAEVAAVQAALIAKIAAVRVRPIPAPAPVATPLAVSGTVGAAGGAAPPEGTEAPGVGAPDAAVSYTAVSDAGAAASLKRLPAGPVVKIRGKATVSRVLKAKLGTWSGTPKVTYQWYRSGKKIKGATKAWYRLTKADVGKRISVTAIASKPGYAKAIKTSAKTPRVTS